MKYRKTPQAQRTVYRQYDDDGNLLYEFTPDEHGAETRVEVIEANKEKIRVMHAMDDHEVYVNSKELKASPWQKENAEKANEQYRAAFTEKYGYEPDRHDLPYKTRRDILSIDMPVKGNTGDTSTLGESEAFQEEMTKATGGMEEVNDRHELILSGSSFTEREAQVYETMLSQMRDFGELSQKDIARTLGLSEGRVSQIIGSISKKLAQCPEVKKSLRG